MLRQYEISGPHFWMAKVAIDEDFIITTTKVMQTTTKDAIKGMVELWADREHYLSLNDGDYTRTFLQQLGRQMMYEMCEYDHNIEGLLHAFEGKEGWCKMDGSMGIKIIDAESFEFSRLDFDVIAGPE